MVGRLWRCHGGIFVLGREPGSGVWWRFEFDDDVRARLRATVRDWNDLSINVLELLGMVVMAWIFVTQSDARPSYARDTVLMRGDNMSAVQWVFKCRGGREPRSGALMRLLGCLEVGSGWCFDALHVAGVENAIADGISRWKPEDIDGNLRAFRPDVAWHRQVLEPTGVAVCFGVLACLSVAPSSHRAYTSGFRSWAAFRGLIGEAEYFDAAVSDTDKIQELLEFVAWYASEGNQAGTRAKTLSAVPHFHGINIQMELPTSSPLINRALKGVTRLHVAAGTPKGVRYPI